jgi:hypothetical protein
MSATAVTLEPVQIHVIADRFAFGAVTSVAHTGKVYQLLSVRGGFALRCFNTGVSHAHVTATHTARRALRVAGFLVGLSEPASPTRHGICIRFIFIIPHLNEE